MNVGQSVVSALKLVDELLVVDSEQVHDGGIQVVNVHGVLRNVVAVVIRCPKREAFLDSGSGQKYGEATGMVIPAVIGSGKFALRINRSSKLTTPNDQGVFKQAALTQVGDQGGCRLVRVATLPLDRIGKASMVIPAHVKELDATNIAFSHPSCEQTIGRVGTGLPDIRSIAF